jgi:hypothetical protein
MKNKGTGSGASKVLFIPNSANQLNKFLAIAANLGKGFDYVVLNLDIFKNSFTLGTLREKGIPHLVLRDLSGAGAEQLLRGQRIGVIVVGNDAEALSYLFLQAGRRLGIPSLLVQEGAICWRTPKSTLPLGPAAFLDILSVHSPQFLLHRLIAKLKKAPRPHLDRYGQYSDFVAAWGKVSVANLVRHGVPRGRITVTGSPTLDSVADYKGNRMRILEKIGAADRKTLFYAASDMIGASLWSREEFADCLQALCDSTRRLDMQLIVKQHPFHYAREPHYLSRFVDGKSVFSGNQLDALSIISASDALVTEVSSCASEAIALDKPVGIINLVNRPFISEPFPRAYLSAGVALLVESKSAMEGTLRSLLFDKKLQARLGRNRRHFIADHFYRLDGRSGRRIASLIRKIAAGKEGAGAVR